jgi:hypothetical protein
VEDVERKAHGGRYQTAVYCVVGRFKGGVVGRWRGEDDLVIRIRVLHLHTHLLARHKRGLVRLPDGGCTNRFLGGCYEGVTRVSQECYKSVGEGNTSIIVR